MIYFKELQDIVSELPMKHIFVTVSGAHLYGFESHNSDIDLRWVFLPTWGDIFKYSQAPETIERFRNDPLIYPLELDIVSHSLLKFLYLLTKSPNGYVLEQLFSPLVVVSSDYHISLQQFAKCTITKQLEHHYGGFFYNQKKLLQWNSKKVKLILYQLRIICSAVYTARTGRICANLLECNNEILLFPKSAIDELIALKKEGEKNNFQDNNLYNWRSKQIESAFPLIHEEYAKSSLPDFDKKESQKLRDIRLMEHSSFSWR